MTERVIDASALLLTVMRPAPTTAGTRTGYIGTFLHAPHLIDAECGNALRRIVRQGELSADEGHAVLRTTGTMIDTRHGHGILSALAWSLRDQLSYYDALYVALAVRLDLPLITCDRRLANAPGLPCVVELVG